MTNQELNQEVDRRIEKAGIKVEDRSRIYMVAQLWADIRGWNGGPLFQLGLDAIVAGIDPEASPPNVDKMLTNNAVSEDIAAKLKWTARVGKK